MYDHKAIEEIKPHADVLLSFVFASTSSLNVAGERKAS